MLANTSAPNTCRMGLCVGEAICFPYPRPQRCACEDWNYASVLTNTRRTANRKHSPEDNSYCMERTHWYPQRPQPIRHRYATTIGLPCGMSCHSFCNLRLRFWFDVPDVIAAFLRRACGRYEEFGIAFQSVDPVLEICGRIIQCARRDSGHTAKHRRA